MLSITNEMLAITNDQICKTIIDRFIKEHPDLHITIELVKLKLLDNLENYDLKIDEYSNYITEWRNKKGFQTDKNNTAEKCMLIVTEISEAVEADRKDDIAGFQEEMADAYIRIMDLTSALGYNQMNNIIRVKMALNEFRPPKHGKKY